MGEKMGGTKQYFYWVLWGLTVWIQGVSCVGKRGVPRLSQPLTNNLKSLPFEEAYMPLFGDSNVQVPREENSVKLVLDKRSGSGLMSHDLYYYGFFSASIKLPEDYTAGIVTAFYTSNGDIFEHNHDELDFEFLGNIRGKEWRVQTNVYGNGSTAFGREERYKLWFDPTEGFHQYSILWTDRHIVFFIDDIPIREVERSEAMGGQYPVKPMSVYATIWDGSEWATAGGRYKVNYKYAPFYYGAFQSYLGRVCRRSHRTGAGKREENPLCRGKKSPKPSSCQSYLKNRGRQWNGLEANTYTIPTVMTLPDTHLSWLNVRLETPKSPLPLQLSSLAAIAVITENAAPNCIHLPPPPLVLYNRHFASILLPFSYIMPSA